MNAVRRIGCSPIGSIPASLATVSPQAPEALTTEAQSMLPSGVETRHPPPSLARPVTGEETRIFSPCPSCDANEGLVEGSDVDVEGIRLIDRPRCALAAASARVAISRGCQPTPIRHRGHRLSCDGAQMIESGLIGDPEETAIREKRSVYRVIRRVFEERPARQPKGA